MVFFENLYFAGMLVTYGIFISFLYDKLRETPSISRIIEENREPIFYTILVFCLFTVLYEIQRYRKFSIFISIIILFIGLFGVILISEKNIWHFLYVGLVVSSIAFFMFSHCLIKRNDGYWLLFYLTILAFIGCLVNMDTNISYWEAGFMGIFAIFYISLHF